MDANGNKVQTLRQQFEKKNYEKVENVGVANVGTTTFNKFPPSILKSSTKGEGGGGGGGSNKAEMITGSGRDLGNSLSTNANQNQKKNDTSKTNNANNSSLVVEDVRRNGIYVSNSITLSSFQKQQQQLHQQSPDFPTPASNACIIPPSLKRRPMVLDLHQVGNEGFMDDMMLDGGGTDLKGGVGNGDDLSITSSSSSTCVNLLNTGNYGDGDGGKETESQEPQALTPTSNSSSASSGSGYGKVKRSNAFRANNNNNNSVAVNNPVTPTTNEGPIVKGGGNDSRFVNKSKLVLERVKSLDTATSSGSSSSGQKISGSSSNTPFNNEHQGSGSGMIIPAQRAASVCLRPSQSSSQIYDAKVPTPPSTAQIMATSTGKAVNIVTPYQVSDIYSQIRKGLLAQPNSQAPGTRKPAAPGLQPQEVEYAVPIITRKSSQLHNKVNDGSSRQTPVSPPKIPPAPQNYPPSAVLGKDHQNQNQIGLPGSSDSCGSGSGSPYPFLQQRRRCSPYEEKTSASPHKVLGQGQGQGPHQHQHPEIIMKRSCVGGTPHPLIDSESVSSSSLNSTPSSSKAFPPSKPPRTFLYDILPDHRQATSQQPQRAIRSNSNNNLHANPNGSTNPSELYMETSSTTKKPLTVADSLNSSSLLGQNSNRNVNQNQSQTHTNANNNSNANPKRQYSSSSSSSTLTSSTTSYKQPQSGRGNISVSTATVRQTNKSNSNLLLSKNQNQHQLNNGSGGVGGMGPGTNQKSKSASTIASPSSGGIHPNEILLSSSNNNNNNGANSSSKRGVQLPVVYTITANHHPPLVRSKTESQLVVKSKSNWNYPVLSADSESIGHIVARGGGGGGGHNATNTTMSNYDYGYKTTPFHPGVGNVNIPQNSVTNASSNNYYSPPHHHQSQNLLNNQRIYDGLPQYRSTTNLLKHNNRYPSNPGLYQAGGTSGTSATSWNDHRHEHGLPPTNNARYPPHPHVYPSHSHNQRQAQAHPHFHDHRSNSLMYMTTEIDLEKGQHIKTLEGGNNANSNGLSVFTANTSSINKSVNVNRCSSDDRLCERSKSDWALNHVHNPSNPSPSGVGIGNGGRRNTVTVTPGGGNSTGHPSLESTASSNLSSSTPQPHPNGTNGTNNNSNPNNKRPGIQQSIQNLVNQLFSASSTMKDATSSTDSGIQLGSESLSSCDTPVGDSTTDTGDSDCENDGDTTNTARQVVEARKGYVRRVSSIRVQELGAGLNQLIQNSKKIMEPLFECLLVIGLNRDPYTGVYHAYIRDKFPPNAKLPSGVEQFCFPDSLEWPCHEGSSAQFYTLAITDQRGSRKFGCCYRILPEGANICIPITYCIVSSHRAIGFYREVLREITLRHGYSEYQKRFWMEELYKKQFPLTGGNITITEPTVEDLYAQSQRHRQAGGGHNDSTVGVITNNCYNNYSLAPTKTVSIKRRPDSRLDEGDLITLLTTVDLPTILKIFGSLLLERKVVLISRALSTLSLCVEALESMLYPFSWQHTFVPILPLNMTDVLDAPAPFLIGVLRSSQTPWDKTLDEGIVVDLDQNKVISCVGDEGTILPKRIHRKLKEALLKVLDLTEQKESTKNVLMSECFIRMFVETMGHHAHHIVVQQDGMKIFERESFVKSCDSKAVQNFLEWFSETSMFHEFTQFKLKNTQQHGLFEQRVLELYEQSQSQLATGGGTPLTFKNAKLFMNNRTRPLGNWLKEAFVK